MSVAKWTWVYWAIEQGEYTSVGAYETDGTSYHGDVPSVGRTYTIISEAQMRSLAIEQRQRAYEALDIA